MKLFFAGACIADESVAAQLGRTITGYYSEVLFHSRDLQQGDVLVLIDGSVHLSQETVHARYGNPTRTLHICTVGDVYNGEDYERVVGHIYTDAISLTGEFLERNNFTSEGKVNKR